MKKDPDQAAQLTPTEDRLKLLVRMLEDEGEMFLAPAFRKELASDIKRLLKKSA